MSPKPFAIVPVPHLIRCAGGECAYYNGGSRTEDRRWVAPEVAKIDNPPCDRDVEPDLRYIGITIGVRLAADLHQSDYRHKHDQIPRPSQHEVRAALSERESAKRNHYQSRRRTDNLPERKFARMMI